MIEFLVEVSDNRENDFRRVIVFSDAYNSDYNPPVLSTESFDLDSLGWQELLKVLTAAQERAKAQESK